jgi:hypothetical protein
MTIFFRAQSAGATELFVNGNAAALSPNEANSVGAFGQVGLDVGANVFESQASVVTDGSYALHANSQDTPTAAARFYYDLDTILTTSTSYDLTLWIRHIGSGDDWRFGLGNVTNGYGGGGTIIDTLANTATTWTEYNHTFTHGANTQYLSFRELGDNSGGVYVDGISIVES